MGALGDGLARAALEKYRQVCIIREVVCERCILATPHYIDNCIFFYHIKGLQYALAPYELLKTDSHFLLASSRC